MIQMPSFGGNDYAGQDIEVHNDHDTTSILASESKELSAGNSTSTSHSNGNTIYINITVPITITLVHQLVFLQCCMSITMHSLR